MQMSRRRIVPFDDAVSGCIRMHQLPAEGNIERNRLPTMYNQSPVPPEWAASIEQWMDREERMPLFVVDSHTAGNPTRILLSGPTFPGVVKTVDDARAWLRDSADWV